MNELSAMALNVAKGAVFGGVQGAKTKAPGNPGLGEDTVELSSQKTSQELDVVPGAKETSDSSESVVLDQIEKEYRILRELSGDEVNLSSAEYRKWRESIVDENGKIDIGGSDFKDGLATLLKVDSDDITWMAVDAVWGNQDNEIGGEDENGKEMDVVSVKDFYGSLLHAKGVFLVRQKAIKNGSFIAFLGKKRIYFFDPGKYDAQFNDLFEYVATLDKDHPARKKFKRMLEAAGYAWADLDGDKDVKEERQQLIQQISNEENSVRAFLDDSEATQELKEMLVTSYFCLFDAANVRGDIMFDDLDWDAKLYDPSDASSEITLEDAVIFGLITDFVIESEEKGVPEDTEIGTDEIKAAYEKNTAFWTKLNLEKLWQRYKDIRSEPETPVVPEEV